MLRNALHEELRASAGAVAADVGVAQAMRERMAQEEQDLAKQSQRVQKAMDEFRLAKKTKSEAKEMQARVTASRKKKL